ncbi:MAG: hypothetical protein ABIJ59_00365 [Pseudomonadota bacterium]
MRIRPKHSTMRFLKLNRPLLYPDEQIVLEDQGGFKHLFLYGWKPAHIFLTTKRLILCQLQKIVFEINLSAIFKLAFENNYYILRKRQILCVHYKEGKRQGTLRIVVNGLHTWNSKLFQSTLLKVDDNCIEMIAKRLDDNCRTILWFLKGNSHARIDQLADIIDAANHMEVLTHIKDAINPVAQKLLGCPLLSFERSRVDPFTGKTVLFSWWLAGEQEQWSKDRLLDIFDEKEYFQIILEVKKVEKSDLNISLDGSQLMIESLKVGSKWVEKFTLSQEAVFANHKICLKNNFLEIKLFKKAYHLSL